MNVTLFQIEDRETRETHYAIKYIGSNVMHVFFNGATKSFSYKDPKKFVEQFLVVNTFYDFDIVEMFSKVFSGK